MAASLEHMGKYNELTDEFRNQIEETVEGYGDVVRYKFNVGRPDPHPDNKGQIVYPSMWTLDPVTFDIIDPFEKRPGKQKLKKIGIATESIDEKGDPILLFERVRVFAKDKSILTLNIKNPEEKYMAMYLEIHPKNNGGKYQNKSQGWAFERIDELKLATTNRGERKAKAKALTLAQDMSDASIQEFADGMGWDLEKVDILRDKVEGLAESQPEFFNTLIDSKKVEFQANVKRALDRQIIGFDPTDYKFIWVANQQVITILSPSSEKSHVEKLAEWLQVGDKKSTEVYNKIKSLLKA